MADLIIFGATPSGAQLKASLPAGDRVLCFADFDREKCGTTFEGCNVVQPAALVELTFDRLLIATTDPAGTLTFLLKLGIPLDKIDAGSRLPPASDDRRPAAVIYGSRLEALRTLQHVEPRYRVLCFCDADPAMQGRRVADRFVIAPADLCTLRFDRIFIGVPHTYEAVHALLWHWGVAIDRMDVAPESVLFPPAAARSSDRPRTVIFGAGSSGEQTLRRVGGDCDVIGFIDNSPSKQGTSVCGLPVHAATALATLDYDRVIIGSMYVAEIMSQLATLGVDSRKIALPDQAIVHAPARQPAPKPGLWRRLFAHAASL
jgi:hypothetical protein